MLYMNQQVFAFFTKLPNLYRSPNIWLACSMNKTLKPRESLVILKVSISPTHAVLFSVTDLNHQRPNCWALPLTKPGPSPVLVPSAEDLRRLPNPDTALCPPWRREAHPWTEGGGFC